MPIAEECPAGHKVRHGKHKNYVFRGLIVRCAEPGHDYDKTLGRNICGCVIGEHKNYVSLRKKGVSLRKKSDSVPQITKKRVWTDIGTNKVTTVEFECGLCGEMNVTPNFKKIEEDKRVKYQVECYECSTKGFVSP
jgi:predicted RNA-binding Zn-ribbon protein involved in translation (DUF1610 family)